MARLLTSRGVYGQDATVPGQTPAGSGALSHADPTDHLGQIGSFFPDQEIRFGNLEFTADSRGELVWMRPSTPMEKPVESDALTPEASGIGHRL